MGQMENIEYPIRINRYLLLKGYCSRRKADEFIKQGQVRINGKLAQLGSKVEQGDKVTVGKLIKRAAEERVYYAFYKPVGVVTHNPQKGETGIEDIFKPEETVHPIGRLDKASHGLVLLSNDGRIPDRLLNPKYEHEKEYIVFVDKPLKERVARRMSKGMWLDDFKAKPCFVQMTGPKSLRIILTEGKKHQIRRMCAAVGYQVTDLKRVRVMNITLGSLQPEEYRKVEGKELRTFLSSLGLE
jgi:23S rRNA pseudouridine2604 synthase